MTNDYLLPMTSSEFGTDLSEYTTCTTRHGKQQRKNHVECEHQISHLCRTVGRGWSRPKWTVAIDLRECYLLIFYTIAPGRAYSDAHWINNYHECSKQLLKLQNEKVRKCLQTNLYVVFLALMVRTTI